MPILTVDIVGSLEDREARVARDIAQAAAAVLETGPQDTWAQVRFIPPSHYAENAGGPAAGVQPVIVRVLKYRNPQGPELDRQVAALTDAIAEACGRPRDNVHLIYEPPGQDRVAFGGSVAR